MKHILTLLTALLLAPLAVLHAADAPTQPPAVPALQPVDISQLPSGIKHLDLFLLMAAPSSHC